MSTSEPEVTDTDPDVERAIQERQEEEAVIRFYSPGAREPQLIDTTQMPLVDVKLTPGDITEWIEETNAQRAESGYEPISDPEWRAAKVHKHAPQIQAALQDHLGKILGSIMLYGTPAKSETIYFPRAPR